MPDEQTKPGPFGGLSASEAGRRGAEARERRKAAAAVSVLTDEEAMIAGLMQKAKSGDPRAAQVLIQLGVVTPQGHRGGDQGLLALLTPEQRQCIEHALKGELAPDELALEAWSRRVEVPSG
jgi:hypothetical protein